MLWKTPGSLPDNRRSARATCISDVITATRCGLRSVPTSSINISTIWRTPESKHNTFSLCCQLT